MKTKFLIFIISFIFIITTYAQTIYAITNEIIEEDTIENVENEDIITEENIESEEFENDIVETVSANDDIRGELCIDYPRFNSEFTVPNTEQITIEGWAVSNAPNSIVKIFIDGNQISDIKRKNRPDVDNIVSPNYGGTANTPQAGYISVIDISKYTIGNHLIKVRLEAENGKVLSVSETSINIKSKGFRGVTCIDSPINNYTFIRGENTNLNLEGWAVSNDSKSVIKIYIDENEVRSNITRKLRPDVDKIISPNYEGVEMTPKAGFLSQIDIGDIVEGDHIIQVREESRYGELLSISNIKVIVKDEEYKGLTCMDFPYDSENFIIPDTESIKVEGWSVSEDKNAKLRVLVDENEINCNINRKLRPDVDKIISPNYGGVEKNQLAGFDAIVPITNLRGGIHKIKVEQVSKFGKIISVFEKNINIIERKYDGLVYIDSPQNNIEIIKQDTKEINLEGWAVSDDSNARIRILIDEQTISENCARKLRSDVDTIVSPQFGGIKNTPNSGFLTTINIENLSIGRHNIKVQEISRFGQIISFYNVTINIVNKKYTGEMCLDLPTYNQKYTMGDNITVSGWAVSQDSDATVEIYIDDNLNCLASRYYRQDVEYFMQKYGSQTLNAGFGKMISTNNFSVGTHKLKVYEKSRYGDIIGGIEVVIFINAKQNAATPTISSNNTLTSGSKGIDVSQFQGNIDWTAVKNSGIKFAMIRLGYRGYGTGKLVEDTKFKTNFINAVNSGLKVGVYLYSSSINVEEAKQDAEYIMQILRKYGYNSKVSMPIVIDLELVSGVNTRDKNVSRATRTAIANTFCETIAKSGFVPMVYACTSFLNSNLNSSQIPYDIWVAQYNSKCTYGGKYTMWQYSSSGKINGIAGNVDVDICYKNY